MEEFLKFGVFLVLWCVFGFSLGYVLSRWFDFDTDDLTLVEIAKLPLWNAETDRGMGKLERVAKSIPEAIWQKWSNFSIYLFAAFIGCWIGVIALAVSLGVIEIGKFALSPSLPPLEPEAPAFEFSKVLEAGLQLILMYLLYLAIFVLILPGLVLHEFGHFTAGVRNGFEIESYGLMFWAIIPLGAFVRFDEEGSRQEYCPQKALEVYSAGVGNNAGWAALLATAGVVIASTTSGGLAGVIAGMQDPVSASWSVGHVLATVLFVTSLFELLLAWTNSVPIWKFDGGHYFRTVKLEWWGFRDAISKVRL